MLYLPTTCARANRGRVLYAEAKRETKGRWLGSLVCLSLVFVACDNGRLGSGGSPYQGGANPQVQAPGGASSGTAPAANPGPSLPPAGSSPAPAGPSVPNIDPSPTPPPGAVAPQTEPGPTPGPTPTATPTPAPPPMPATATPPPAGPPPTKILVSDIEMPQGVRDILERRCSACHTYGERDPIGWGSVLDLSRMISSDIIVPGDPDKSRIINRVAIRSDMPYNGQRLPGGDVQVLRAWIANLNRPTQKPRTHEDIMDLIVADQAKLGNRGNDYRYVSFLHFADERRSPEELDSAASVFSVVLNSLSRKAAIVKPVAADPGRTLWRFRLADVGWGEDDWDEVIAHDPYCVRSNKAAHRAVYDRLRTEGVVVRGDWFLATATKPPLYERLLDIPQTLQELEDDLGIDINANLNRARPDAIRIGFRSSGVSANNRMIERHKLRNGGFFWISYDFASNEDDADLRENPLGPQAANEKNFNRVFQHDGGEVIYSLPNGMQAYLLINAAGQRIDQAPKEIVKDARRRPGAVENGISCIGCHGVTGMNHPRVYDEIVKYADEHKNRFNNRELQEIRTLYPANGAQILNADANRYLAAMQAAGGRRVDPGTIEYDEFINLVGQYEGKVGLRAGAMELALEFAATKALVEKGRNEDALPLQLADPLVTRDDFICRMRRIVPTVGTRPQFCSGSFSDDKVRSICD